MVIYDNEFETEKNKILTKGKIEPQICVTLSLSFVFRCEDERFEVCLEFIYL